ncbi:MAG: hypothetical protein Q8P84_09200 [Deltaproteobacteria bacterium]|nr:hypothetical protein [Deltaproteobacteria bacterium]
MIQSIDILLAEDVVRAYAAGACSYVQKPSNFMEVDQIVIPAPDVIPAKAGISKAGSSGNLGIPVSTGMTMEKNRPTKNAGRFLCAHIAGCRTFV